jgi:hypothetical protein
MWPIVCPETSVRTYHYSLRHGPEERSSHPLRARNQKLRIPQGLSSFLTPHPSPRSAYLQTFLCSPQETETGALFLCAPRIFLHPSAMIHTGGMGRGLNHSSSFSKKPYKKQGTRNLNTATGKQTTQRTDERIRILINKRWPRGNSFRLQL